MNSMVVSMKQLRARSKWGMAVLLGAGLLACSADRESDPLASFKNQTLAWHDCDSSIVLPAYADLLARVGTRARCATMEVPRDYANPARETISVGLLKVDAQKASANPGVIMFSPGGPGLDSPVMPIAFAYRWGSDQPAYSSQAKNLYKQLADGFDLIGWSPRGVGMSSQLNCASAQLAPLYVDAPSDRSQANIDAMLETARLEAAACRSQPLTPFINSDATARDLDLMRHLLKQEKLNFYGLSYATWLGTWYATLFPDRVGNMVLVGNTDTTSSFDRMWLNNVAALQRVLDDVLAPYAARHPERFDLGSSAAAVTQILARLPAMLQLAASEIMEPGLHDTEFTDNTLLTLRAAQAVKDLLATMASPTEASLRSRINASDFAAPLARSQALALSENYFAHLNATPTAVNMAPSTSVHFAVQCNDMAMSFDEASWVQQNNAQAARYSFFGGHFTSYPCLYWGGPVVPRPALANAAQARSILMLQSQFDPQTPLEGALNSLATLPNASMILVGNAIDHVVSIPYGSDCIDLPLAQYLLDGTRPPRMTQCPGKLLPADAPTGP